jgi:F-type H+-transporting ATPase subunit delta
VKVSKQARREAKGLLRSCLVGGRLDENRVRQALAKVAQQKPRGYAAMLAYFHRLVKLDLERHTARVESAVPLAPPARASLQAGLERRYGGGLQTSFAENPALIGGLRVRVGSDVYDGSIRARLAALEESF